MLTFPLPLLSLCEVFESRPNTTDELWEKVKEIFTFKREPPYDVKEVLWTSVSVNKDNQQGFKRFLEIFHEYNS